MRSLRDADLKGKKVLMRVDFNVPTDKDNNIIDDTKIKAALPTIEYVLQNGGRLVLMSHLGRPKGKADERYSLNKVASRLKHLISYPVKMANCTIGTEVEREVENLKEGEVVLLENVRFYPGEEKNDPHFSRQLAALGEIFVNDAFGTAHRAHSSTAGVADYLPAYSGFLMEKEVSMLREVLGKGQSPRMAILGGAKVMDKLGLIGNLLNKVDIIEIGGGMANTFLKASGINIGKSICEESLLDQAGQLLDDARKKGVQILLPLDAVVAAEISEKSSASIVDINNIPDEMVIVDIGPKTIELFIKAVNEAKTIIWNGPLGVYEYEQFSRGTREVAKAIANSSALSVIGGGDSVAAIHEMGLERGVTHISTGGGATMEFLEGRELPGVAVCEAVSMA